MPFSFCQSAFIKEQVCVKAYLEATCETVEHTFQQELSCKCLRGKVHSLLPGEWTCKSRTVSLVDIEYLLRMLICISSWIPEGIYCLKWVSFPLPSTPYLFFPAMKVLFSKITCLAKSEAFLMRILGHRHDALTFLCKKSRYQDARCFGGRVRTNLKIADRGKLMSRIVNYLISFLTIWCTLRQLLNWHSPKRSVPMGQVLLLQKRSQSWHLWAVKVILQGVAGGQCSEMSRWDISVALKSS